VPCDTTFLRVVSGALGTVINMFKKNHTSAPVQEMASLLHLSRQHARIADQIFTEAKVPAGTTLSTQGSNVKQLVFVLDGEIGVSRDGVSLATLSRGDVLGEITALDIAPEQTATAVTLTDARVLVAGRLDLGNLVSCTGLHLHLQSTASKRLVGTR
jgi:CRP-like cAMP-binding protein